MAAFGMLCAEVAREMQEALAVMASRIELVLEAAQGRSLPAQVSEQLRFLHRDTLGVARTVQRLLAFADPLARERPGRTPAPRAPRRRGADDCGSSQVRPGPWPPRCGSGTYSTDG